MLLGCSDGMINSNKSGGLALHGVGAKALLPHVVVGVDGLRRYSISAVGKILL